MKRINPKVDSYLKRAKRWREEMEKLREIILGFEFAEELKWGKPCYTFQGSNIVLIVGFKEYCALMFCKGALLKDAKGLLIKPGENTQTSRQIRFTNVREITKLQPVLKRYIRESIDAEKAGKKVKFEAIRELKPSEELQQKLDENPALNAAFAALTPGRQRAYNMYFSAAKQSKTRVSRIEKCTPQILGGKGLNDDYRR